jgi:hypothetical protein
MNPIKQYFMNRLLLKSFLTVVLIAVAFSLFFLSCKKTSPAEATITVVDSLERPIKGAQVILRQDSVVNPSTGVKSDIYDEKITDINGQTFHSFKWEAVLNLQVTKGNLKAIDYLRLEQSKTVSKTVMLK